MASSSSLSSSTSPHTSGEDAPTLCPICLSATLTPQNQCTLRCGHAVCNLCLPQLISPNCPICRQPIWRSIQSRQSPWIVENNSVFLNPVPDLLENGPHADTDESDDTTDEDETRIPVMLLTRDQLRHIFHQ